MLCNLPPPPPPYGPGGGDRTASFLGLPPVTSARRFQVTGISCCQPLATGSSSPLPRPAHGGPCARNHPLGTQTSLCPTVRDLRVRDHDQLRHLRGPDEAQDARLADSVPPIPSPRPALLGGPQPGALWSRDHQVSRPPPSLSHLHALLLVPPRDVGHLPADSRFLHF